MAVRFTSPLPWAACESPVHTSAPRTNTGTCKVAPSMSSRLSRFPAKGRDGVVAPGLRARDAKSTGEGSQRDLDPRAELGHLALPIEVEIFHLAVGEFLRKLPE